MEWRKWSRKKREWRNIETREWKHIETREWKHIETRRAFDRIGLE
jgi:hypothetical protein